MVEHSAVRRSYLDQCIDQRRPLRTPEQFIPIVVDTWVGECDAPREVIASHSIAIAGENLVSRAQRHMKLERVVEVTSANLGGQADFPTFQDAIPLQGVDPRCGKLLNPYRLPDARRSRIPDSVRIQLPILLPARFGEIGWVINRAHDNSLAARAQQ